MPKLPEELTDKVMRNLPVPATGSVLYYDPELAGFAGRVTSKGARAYVGTYYFGGVERRDTIGSYPVWKAPAAKEIFKRWRRDVDLGIDPRGEPEPNVADLLFKPLAEEFLAHGRTKRGRPLEPATKREYRRALLIYLEPLHRRTVGDVHRRDAASLIHAAAVKRGFTTAMRTRAAGSRFYSWLIAKGVVEHNPFSGTEGYDTPKAERTLRDAELAALWATTAEPTDYHMILRILHWTGCRRQEAGGMRWSELSEGIWTVPASRTKNDRPLVLPMPRQLREAVEAWPRRLSRDHLFGSGPHGFQGWSQSKRRLDARLGFDQPWRLHDIRRSVETRMAGLGILKDHVNRVLNHAAGPITEAYDRHSYMPEKAAALQRWADDLERIVGGGENVVRLAGRR